MVLKLVEKRDEGREEDEDEEGSEEGGEEEGQGLVLREATVERGSDLRKDCGNLHRHRCFSAENRLKFELLNS